MSMNILALESATEKSSVALLLADGRISYAQTASGQSHSSSLLVLARGLLREMHLGWQQVDGFVVGVGPGSFTGLRISCGLVQGLATALDKPVLAVNSFEAWAYAQWLSKGMPEAFETDVFFDARLGEQFSASIKIQRSSRDGAGVAGAAPCLSWSRPPAIEPAKDAPCRFSFDPSDWPLAAWLAQLGARAEQLTQGSWMRPDQLRPLYIREQVAQTLSERTQKPDLQWVRMLGDDLTYVMAIERQAYSFPWTEGNFQDSMKAGYEMWVLREHGAIIGYMVWMRALSEAHLLNFTLSPARQGHGLGTWMLESLFNQVRKAHLSDLILEVRPSNQRAIKLYEKFGFRHIGLRKGYYPNHASPNELNVPHESSEQKQSRPGREDALVMSCEVSRAVS